MSKKYPKIIQKSVGYFLLIFSVSAVAIENKMPVAQGHDPFSDSRNATDNEEYPSILAVPDFEQSISVRTAPPQIAQTAVTPSAPTVLKTPVQPAVSGPISGSSGISRYSPLPTRALILHENVLLSQGLDQWAKDSGYKMLWNSPRDYMIYSTITFSGATTDDVLGDLGKLFTSENYGLVIKLYQKNKVLIIDEQ